MLHTSCHVDSDFERAMDLSSGEACDELDGEPSSSGRKANKPLMEKRRRARINKSLMELKSMLMESMSKKQTPGHSKWEKADILEMTVQYVQCLRNQQQATKSDPLSVGQFIAGFSECIRQVQKCDTLFAARDTATSPSSPSSTCEDGMRDAKQRLTDVLLSYLKNFSDDATQGLRHVGVPPQTRTNVPPPNGVQPNRRSGGGLYSPRLKVVPGGVGDGCVAERSSQHSNTVMSQLVSPHSQHNNDDDEQHSPTDSSSSGGGGEPGGAGGGAGDAKTSSLSSPSQVSPSTPPHDYFIAPPRQQLAVDHPSNVLPMLGARSHNGAQLPPNQAYVPLLLPSAHQDCSNDVVAAASLLQQFHNSLSTRQAMADPTAAVWRPW